MEWEFLLCTIEGRNKCYRIYKYTQVELNTSCTVSCKILDIVVQPDHLPPSRGSERNQESCCSHDELRGQAGRNVDGRLLLLLSSKIWRIRTCVFWQSWQADISFRETMHSRRGKQEETKRRTHLKTWASTWHCALCCSRAAAQQDLEETSHSG